MREWTHLPATIRISRYGVGAGPNTRSAAEARSWTRVCARPTSRRAKSSEKPTRGTHRPASTLPRDKGYPEAYVDEEAHAERKRARSQARGRSVEKPSSPLRGNDSSDDLHLRGGQTE